MYVFELKREKEINENFYNDFKVRWNTTYIMIDRALKLKTVINEITNNSESIPNLTVHFIKFYNINLKSIILFKNKLPQKKKLNELIIRPEEWTLLETLNGLLAPFYFATKHIQQQSFPSLSSSKIISNSLIVDYEKRSSMSNKNVNERILSKVLSQNLQKHLHDKINESKKRAALVKFFINKF